MQPDDAETQTEGEPQLPVKLSNLLERVQDLARERPLVVLGAAGGVGFVLGRGLPRFGALVALLGVGGIVGYAATALRSRGVGVRDEGDTDRAANDDATATDASAPGDAADTSDDAHDIHVSSAPPDASPGRKPKKKSNVVRGA